MDQHKAEKFQDFQIITGKTEISYNNKSSRTIFFSLLVSLRYPSASSLLTQTALLSWIHSQAWTVQCVSYFLLYRKGRSLVEPDTQRHCNYCLFMLSNLREYGLLLSHRGFQMGEKNIIISLCFLSRYGLNFPIYLWSVAGGESSIADESWLKYLEQQKNPLLKYSPLIYLSCSVYVCILRLNWWHLNTKDANIRTLKLLTFLFVFWLVPYIIASCLEL